MNDIKELFSQVTELIFNEVSNKLDQNANVVDGKLTEMYQGVRSLESKISEIVKDTPFTEIEAFSIKDLYKLLFLRSNLITHVLSIIDISRLSGHNIICNC